jgi:hypothetical protein
MKKINVIILFFAFLFLFFTCGEPTENFSSKSKGTEGSEGTLRTVIT